MKTKHSTLTLAALTLTGALCGALPASAQVAGGTTTVNATITESTQIAAGWSVKKTLMGKAIYNDVGQKVGNVEDLIISPDRSISYVIVGAGGFVGIGRHDVAIPVTQIKDQSGKLVMAGATKDMIKSMPGFSYAIDTTQRDQYMASAEKDIAKGKTTVTDLEKKAGVAETLAKAKIDLQITALRVDVKSAETKLAEMKQATAARWKEFEASVSAATARLRKSIDTSVA
ncbi:MAG: PRC-barrel domain-containing protein [Caldimonas sp.]